MEIEDKQPHWKIWYVALAAFLILIILSFILIGNVFK